MVLALVAIDYVIGLFAAGAEGEKGTGPGLKSKIGLIGGIYLCNGSSIPSD
ncbi:hypothetical protein [Paenibacillus sp. JJ1683]|nr:phage lysis holin [Paenibacillus polymyxa]